MTDTDKLSIALSALREIETICNESVAACRKRMGTRAGNSLVTARKAIKNIESAFDLLAALRHVCESPTMHAFEQARELIRKVDGK